MAWALLRANAFIHELEVQVGPPTTCNFAFGVPVPTPTVPLLLLKMLGGFDDHGPATPAVAEVWRVPSGNLIPSTPAVPPIWNLAVGATPIPTWPVASTLSPRVFSARGAALRACRGVSVVPLTEISSHLD